MSIDDVFGWIAAFVAFALMAYGVYKACTVSGSARNSDDD